MNPSLLLIPDRYKASKLYSQIPDSGAGDLAFTRANDTATRVNSAGLIEKVRTNLILQSQTFDNASWTKDSATITANTTTAPDGTTTADTLTILDTQYIYQSVTLTAGVSYTISIYVRVASATNQFKLNTFGSSNNFISSTLTATTSWQRFSFTFTAVGSGSTAIYPLIVDGLAGGSFFIWGAQFEATDFGATPYIPTTTAAVSVGPIADIPRIDYTGGGCGKLLLEPQRTNLALFSEQFNNADWTKGFDNATLTVTANQSTAPDGTISADKVVLSAVTGAGHYAVVAQGFTATAAAFSGSFYFKGENGGEVIYISYTKDGVNYTRQLCTLTTSWQRFTLTSTLTAGADNIQFGVDRRDGSQAATPAQTFYVWGAQLEAGSYATSYIPTLGAQVTRSADAASKTASLLNETNFSIFLDYVALNGEFGSAPIFGFTETAGNNLEFYVNNENGLNVYVDLGGGYLFGTADNAGFTIGLQSKVLVTYNGTTLKYFINGVLYGSAASSLPYTARALFLNGNKSIDTQTIAFYSAALSDSEAIQLTTL